jgi:hypothetical protein
MNEIDALTADVLPLLVAELKADSMRIKEGDRTPPSKTKGKRLAKELREFGGNFSSPEVHSTLARRHPLDSRGTKTSARKRNHFSLPRYVFQAPQMVSLLTIILRFSLGLGKDGVHSLATWGAEIRGALEHKVGPYTLAPSKVEIGGRNTVFGAESLPNSIPNLRTVQEEESVTAPPNASGLGRSMTTRFLGLRPEVPHSVDTARSSMVSTIVSPISAASTVTLFEDFWSSSGKHSTQHSFKTIETKHYDHPYPNKAVAQILYISNLTITARLRTLPLKLHPHPQFLL